MIKTENADFVQWTAKNTSWSMEDITNLSLNILYKRGYLWSVRNIGEVVSGPWLASAANIYGIKSPDDFFNFQMLYFIRNVILSDRTINNQYHLLHDNIYNYSPDIHKIQNAKGCLLIDTLTGFFKHYDTNHCNFINDNKRLLINFRDSFNNFTDCEYYGAKRIEPDMTDYTVSKTFAYAGALSRNQKHFAEPLHNFINTQADRTKIKMNLHTINDCLQKQR